MQPLPKESSHTPLTTKGKTVSECTQPDPPKGAHQTHPSPTGLFGIDFYDTLLSSQGADAHRPTPSSRGSGQPFKLSQMFPLSKIRVTGPYPSCSPDTPQVTRPSPEGLCLVTF